MRPIGWLLAAGVLLVAVAPASAQDPGPRPMGADTMTLQGEREVFRYPEYARRNPFKTLIGADDIRFDQIRLIGIIYSSDSSKSVAMVTDSEPGGERRPSRRVRVGDRVGTSMLVLEIQPGHIVMEVTEFGLADRRTLELRPRTEGQGGPR